MKSKTKVSVIIPSLNVEKYISECLDSVINQTMKDIEIICVDAGSTDGTLETIKEFAKKDQRIKVLNSDMKSYGRQMNMGLEIAQGEYIAFLDSDDFVDVSMFETLYNAGTKIKERKMDVVSADYSIFYDAEIKQRVYQRRKAMPDFPYNEEFDPRFNSKLYIYSPAYWKSIFNKTFLIDNQITFNETKGAAFQDTGFFIQIYSCAEKVFYVNRSFYRYRLGRDGQSVASVDCVKYTYDEYKRLLSDDNIRKKIIYPYGVYCRMAASFNWIFNVAFKASGYKIDNFSQYFYWLKNEIISNKEFLEKFSIDYPIHYRNVVQLLYNHEKYISERIKIDYDNYHKNNKKTGMVKDVFSKNQLILDTVSQIIKNNETNYALEKQCVNRGIRNVIVYGYGVLGKVVYRELWQSKVKILAIMDSYPDKVMGAPKEIELIALEDDNKLQYDGIIVTAVAAYDTIKKNLTAKGYKNIVNILELV
jgi:glycosyltransferase involved in cell wall biosynthesis